MSAFMSNMHIQLTVSAQIAVLFYSCLIELFRRWFYVWWILLFRFQDDKQHSKYMEPYKGNEIWPLTWLYAAEEPSHPFK